MRSRQADQGTPREVSGYITFSASGGGPGWVGSRTGTGVYVVRLVPAPRDLVSITANVSTATNYLVGVTKLDRQSFQLNTMAAGTGALTDANVHFRCAVND